MPSPITSASAGRAREATAPPGHARLAWMARFFSPSGVAKAWRPHLLAVAAMGAALAAGLAPGSGRAEQPADQWAEPPAVQWAQEGLPVSLELVLAVDASSSINRSEFDLQMRGLAEAFRHPQVHQALAVAGAPGIAVMLLQWADSRHQSISVEWERVYTPEEAEAFADAIDATPRFVVGGGTAIGSAITYASSLIWSNRYAGLRQVIDLSGDGRANQGELPNRARDSAVAAGIVINGLTILNEDPALYVYYEQYVIGGPGAFVMTAQDFTAYSDAIVEKLVREISGSPVALWPEILPPAPGLAQDAQAAQAAQAGLPGAPPTAPQGASPTAPPGAPPGAIQAAARHGQAMPQPLE